MSISTTLFYQTIHHWILNGMNRHKNTTDIPVTVGNDSSVPLPQDVVAEPICQWILYKELAHTRIRIWDLSILVPNALFMMFLLWNIKLAILNLQQRRSYVIAAFYILVAMVSAFSVLRCIVAMTVNASVQIGDITDKTLWLILRFFLLATELSVIVFGLAFGHLDSKTSIRRVLLTTFLLALIYSFIQGTLEFVYPDPNFHKFEPNYDLFAHGGMIFWMSSSALFFIVYTVVYVLPWSSLVKKLHLPSKKSFYYYALFLAVLNCAQMIGSSLLYSGHVQGMCIVDATTYIYFSCFHPLVYYTFLRDFFRMPPQDIPYSYKFQIEESQDEHTVIMPCQRDDEYNKHDNFGDTASVDSTHFSRYNTASINSDHINVGYK